MLSDFDTENLARPCLYSEVRPLTLFDEGQLFPGSYFQSVGETQEGIELAIYVGTLVPGWYSAERVINAVKSLDPFPKSLREEGEGPCQFGDPSLLQRCRPEEGPEERASKHRTILGQA